MKNILTLLIMVFGIGFMSMAQNKLIIEVTTDKYADETTWALYDLDKNVVATNGVLVNETTHRDTITLNPELCYFWTIYDDYSDGMSASGDLGDYKLYLDNVLVGECADNDFGDSISVYSIGSVCSKNDVGIEELTFSVEQTFTPFSVSANVVNMGSEPISSLELVYLLDGVESAAMTIDNLDINVGGLAEISYPELLELKVAKSYTLGLKVTKVNGEVDENQDNNSLSQAINVANGYLKIPLHEIFTSSTCPPCTQGNIVLDGVLDNYDSTLYSLIKYQVNWPGSGDPYYTPDVGKIKNQYGVSAVPSLYVELEGQTPHEYTTEKFDGYSGQVSSVGVKMTAQAIGDSVFVNLTLESAVARDNNHYRIAIVEKTTYGNVGTNGEKKFHNVFMKFVTDWRGDDLGVMNAGEEVNLTYAVSMENTFVEEMDDLRVILYFFESSPYKVVQSKMIEVPYSSAPPVISFNIEQDSMDVDTLSSIVISSNEDLVMLDGSDITDISSVITFAKENAQGEAITFTGNFDNQDNIFTITPDKALDPSTKYYVELHSVKSNYDIEVTGAYTSFTTISGVGINDNLFSDISVYPNPATEELNISVKQKSFISISDVTGSQIKSKQELEPGLTTINIQDLDKGIYFITIIRETQSRTQKFIKQ